MKRALFPGSFNPLTKGHLDTVECAAKLFDEAVIGVFINTSRKNLFPLEERTISITKAVSHFPNVKVMHRENQLTVETAREIGADVLVRGIRSIEDFEYEREVAQMNYHLYDGLETTLLLAKPEYNHVNSSISKEVLHFGGDVSSYLPPVINEALAGKCESNES